MAKVRVRLTRKRIEEAFVEIEVPDPPSLPQTAEEYARNSDYMDNLYRQAIKEAKKLGNVFWNELKVAGPRVSPEKWDKNRDQDEKCVCGHPYHRHFDSYDKMYPVGCKYCECGFFRPKN